MEYKPRKTKCWMCEGRGKTRNNHSENGTYTFSFSECSECAGIGYRLSKQRVNPSNNEAIK